MSDILFGGVESGTPLETRGGAEDMAKFFSALMKGDISGLNNFQRLGSQSFANLFGVTPGDAGTAGVVRDMLADPASQTRGLFGSMRPFENRVTNEAVSGVRSSFGTAGARFSRNRADAESRVRGELGSQFARTRNEALLAAQGQRGNFLATLFQLANQNAALGLEPLNMAARFFQPGAPVVREGLLPGLISAGANLFAASRFRRPNDPFGGIPTPPSTVPEPSDPFGPGGPYYNP